MKKNILAVLLVVLSFTLFACSNENKIRVVATEKPHAEILEFAKPLLKEKGYKLDIQLTDNYAFGNPEVEKGRADANFFQHVPFFEEKNTNGALVNVGGIHLEPIGIYGGTITKFEELKDGDKIIISDNAPDYGRIAAIIADLGLAETVDGFIHTNPYASPEEALKPGSKTVDFKFEVIEAALLTTALKAKEGALFFINGNYAITGNLDISTALFVESPENNPYVNILVVKKGDEELPKFKALYEVLTSQEVKDFILKTYNGTVIPA